MDKKERKYIYVKNPTQINNYGAEENSAQTIARKAKELANDPSPIFSTIDGIIKSYFKYMWKFIKLAVIPVTVCFILGFTFLYITHNPTPNVDSWFWNLYNIFVSFILLPIELIGIAWPLFIIFGCFILCAFWISCIISNNMYPNDPIKRRQARNSIFGAGILAILLGGSKKESGD